MLLLPLRRFEKVNIFLYEILLILLLVIITLLSVHVFVNGNMIEYVPYIYKEHSQMNLDYIDKQIDEYNRIHQQYLDRKEYLSKVGTYDETSLNKRDGFFMGPSGRETYYNLPMDRVVANMRKLGYTEKEYPVNVRGDGVKTLGGYVMVAANLDKYDRGDIIETSLGEGIVCDTGEFVETQPDGIDIAVTW